MNKRKLWVKGKIWAGMVAGMALFLAAAGCGFSGGAEDTPPLVIVAGSDYVEGNAARISVDKKAGFPVREGAELLDGDLGGIEISKKTGKSLAWMVGRSKSIIYKLDPDPGGESFNMGWAATQGIKVLDSFTVGPDGWLGENPQDILIVSKSKAYVTRFGSDDILIVDPRDGTRLGNIVFTGIPTNDDGLARPADMVMAKGKVFVALQNLDAGFNYCEPTIEDGIIAVIDPQTDDIETHVTLLGRANPVRLVYSNKIDRLLIASAGHYSADCGGGWPPDPDVSTSGLELMLPEPPYTVTPVVSGDDALIDGNIYDVALADDDTAYLLATYGFNFEAHALRLSLATGAVDPGFRYPDAATGFDDLAGIGVVQGMVFIGDRALSGVYVHDAVADKEAGFVDLSLPPASMAVLNR